MSKQTGVAQVHGIINPVDSPISSDHLIKNDMKNEITGAAVPAVLRFHFIARAGILFHSLAVSAFSWLAPGSMTGRMLGVDAGFTQRTILLMMTITLLSLIKR